MPDRVWILSRADLLLRACLYGRQNIFQPETVFSSTHDYRWTALPLPAVLDIGSGISQFFVKYIVRCSALRMSWWPGGLLCAQYERGNCCRVPSQSVIVPVFLIGTVNNLAYLEAARLSGDEYPVMPVLIMDALVSIVSACFGCAFPTSVFVGT